MPTAAPRSPICTTRPCPAGKQLELTHRQPNPCIFPRCAVGLRAAPHARGADGTLSPPGGGNITQPDPRSPTHLPAPHPRSSLIPGMHDPPVFSQPSQGLGSPSLALSPTHRSWGAVGPRTHLPGHLLLGWPRCWALLPAAQAGKRRRERIQEAAAAPELVPPACWKAATGPRAVTSAPRGREPPRSCGTGTVLAAGASSWSFCWVSSSLQHRSRHRSQPRLCSDTAESRSWAVRRGYGGWGWERGRVWSRRGRSPAHCAAPLQPAGCLGALSQRPWVLLPPHAHPKKRGQQQGPNLVSALGPGCMCKSQTRFWASLLSQSCHRGSIQASLQAL